MPGNSRQSEKMLSSILQAMPVPVLLARLADGTVLYINPLAAEQLKTSPEKTHRQCAPQDGRTIQFIGCPPKKNRGQ
jgi:PAS domain-containing protein